MIRYKDYFTDVNKSGDINKHIIGLLNLGYEVDELSELLKCDDQIIVEAIDDFAKEQMRKMKFNDLMERLGYEYEREETKSLFG